MTGTASRVYFETLTVLVYRCYWLRVSTIYGQAFRILATKMCMAVKLACTETFRESLSIEERRRPSQEAGTHGPT